MRASTHKLAHPGGRASLRVVYSLAVVPKFAHVIRQAKLAFFVDLAWLGRARESSSSSSRSAKAARRSRTWEQQAHTGLRFKDLVGIEESL